MKSTDDFFYRAINKIIREKAKISSQVRRRTKSVSVGMVGFGVIARDHVQALQQIGGVKLLACADPDEKKLEEARSNFGFERVYNNYIDMLEKECLDIVLICTWPASHAEIIINTARYNIKGIFCEKPFATNLIKAKECVNLCKMKNIKLLIGHQHRFNPFFIESRKRIFGGEIGQIKYVIGNYESCMFNNGTHLIDIITFLLGDPPVEWIFGTYEKKAGISERGIPAEANLMTEICFNSSIKAFITIGEIVHDENSRIEIIGTKGKYQFTRNGFNIFNFSKKINSQLLPAGLSPYYYQHLRFIDWIDKEDKELSRLIEINLKNLELIFSIYKSSKEKKVLYPPVEFLENDSEIIKYFDD